MPAALKDIYTTSFFDPLLKATKKLVSELNETTFLDAVFTENWDQLELKQRISHISMAMECFLPDDFKSASILLCRLTAQLQEGGIKNGGYEYLFIPEYIEKNGLRHPEESIIAIEEITQFVSCEFAIRPFIMKDQEDLMKQMLTWSNHSNHHVRRLSSEGCRPRLPWAPALNELKKNPQSIFPILKNLKADTSLFVRKSVANNLNDITKDHPIQFLKLADRWINQHDLTNWILKHASRTLLKSGNERALTLFGFPPTNQLKLSTFTISNQKIKMGSALEFTFRLRNKSKSNLKLRLEYGIYFKKKNNSNNCKVFKISEKSLESSMNLIVNKSHTIKPISTRTYYPGEQFLAIIINGKEMAKLSFELIF